MSKEVFTKTIDLYVDAIKGQPVIVRCVEGSPVPPLMLEKYRDKLVNAQVIEADKPKHKPAPAKKGE